MGKRILLAATVACSAACTDADFSIPPLVLEHPLDNRVQVSGGFCAEGADDIAAFLKIMFVIDRSNSMQVTDPNTRRSTAVGEVVSQFIEDPLTLKIQDGVEFALISFYGDVITHTRNELGLPGFSKDGPQVMASIVRLAQTSSNTGYDKALATAFQVLDADMARLDDKARARSRYEVFFLSDGMPFPDNCVDEANSLPGAARAVRRIKGLSALHRVSVTFHTGFASAAGMFDLYLNDEDACCLGVDRWPISLVNNCDTVTPGPGGVSIGRVTSELLKTMAAEGGGTFKQFENGDAINFLEFEFAESRRLYALSNFVASNVNARPALDHVEADSDGDGLRDYEEHNLGTNAYYADSDGDGFNDGIEYRFRLSGFDPLDPTDAQCNDLDRVDVDGDGLLDCEEIFLGTLRRSFDTDADGLPDAVEILAGGDANSATPLQDHQADSDADGGVNADEIRWNTNPKIDDVGQRAEIAYDYFQTELPITTGQACYDFQVRNIQLASTIGIPSDRQNLRLCMAATVVECGPSEPCGPGEVCDYARVDPTLFAAGRGACRPEDAVVCSNDFECTGNQTCVRGLGICVPQPPRECDRNAACPNGEVCDFDRVDPERSLVALGACRAEGAPSCQSDADCGAGEACLRAKSQDGWNRIMLYFAQTPYDDPLSEPLYRVACVEGRFIEERDLKVPATGSFVVPPRRPSDTYHAAAVLRPNPVACHVSNNVDCGLETKWCQFSDDGATCSCCDPPICTSDADCPGTCNIPPGSSSGICGCGAAATVSTACGGGRCLQPERPGSPNLCESINCGQSCPACADGQDNDGDGATDFPFDTGCWGSMDNDENGSACSNGVNDDGSEDTAVDFPADPGCDSYLDDDETNPAVLPECSNGIDDDDSGATDWPQDPGCHAASDATEALSLTNPIPHCNDGVDNDGDGLVDMLDPGCSDPNDIDEDGPAVCFSCESFGRARPNQCDIKAGRCRARGGDACTGTVDPVCRGAPCVGGFCSRCINDADCDVITGVAGSGLCDSTRGWCLTPAVTPTECTSDAECANNNCDLDLGYCVIDPYFACRNSSDCAPGDLCSETRGFCLEKVFESRQCNPAVPCAVGTCDEDLGWCLPNREEERCGHDDECPKGSCLPSGACDQQTFVFPEEFRPEVDCLRAD